MVSYTNKIITSFRLYPNQHVELFGWKTNTGQQGGSSVIYPGAFFNYVVITIFQKFLYNYFKSHVNFFNLLKASHNVQIIGTIVNFI